MIFKAKFPKNGKFQDIFFIAFFAKNFPRQDFFVCYPQYKHKNFKFCTLLPAHNQSNHFVGSKSKVFLGQFLSEHPYPIRIFQCYFSAFLGRRMKTLIFWMIFLGNNFSVKFQEKQQNFGWDWNPETT